LGIGSSLFSLLCLIHHSPPGMGMGMPQPRRGSVAGQLLLPRPPILHGCMVRVTDVSSLRRLLSSGRSAAAPTDSWRPLPQRQLSTPSPVSQAPARGTSSTGRFCQHPSSLVTTMASWCQQSFTCCTRVNSRLVATA
jgi:hypothetical protein